MDHPDFLQDRSNDILMEKMSGGEINSNASIILLTL